MLSSSSARPPPRRRQKRSVVWRYFAESPTDLNVAICQLCHAAIPRGRRLARNTTNLLKHLQNKHPTAAQDVPTVVPESGITASQNLSHLQYLNSSSSSTVAILNDSSQMQLPGHDNMVPSISLLHDNNNVLVRTNDDDNCNRNVVQYHRELHSSSNNNNNSISIQKLRIESSPDSKDATSHKSGPCSSTSSSKTTKNSDDACSNALTFSSLGDTNIILPQSTSTLTSPVMNTNNGSALLNVASHSSPTFEFPDSALLTPSMFPISPNFSVPQAMLPASADPSHSENLWPAHAPITTGQPNISVHYSDQLQTDYQAPTSEFNLEANATTLHSNIYHQARLDTAHSGREHQATSTSKLEYICDPSKQPRRTIPCGSEAMRSPFTQMTELQSLSMRRNAPTRADITPTVNVPLAPASAHTFNPHHINQRAFVPCSENNASDHSRPKHPRTNSQGRTIADQQMSHPLNAEAPRSSEQNRYRQVAGQRYRASQQPQTHNPVPSRITQDDGSVMVQQRLTIIKYLAIRGLPLSQISSPDFQEFILRRFGISHFHAPEQQLRNDSLPTILDSLREQTMSRLSAAPACALILNTASTFPVISCTWFSSKFELQSACLEIPAPKQNLSRLDLRRTAFAQVVSIAQTWGIFKKISAVVTSGEFCSASSIGKAGMSRKNGCATQSSQESYLNHNFNVDGDADVNDIVQGSTCPSHVQSCASFAHDLGHQIHLGATQELGPASLSANVATLEGATVPQQCSNSLPIPTSNPGTLTSIPCAVSAFEVIIQEELLSSPTTIALLSQVRRAIRTVRNDSDAYNSELRKFYPANDYPSPLVTDEDTQVCARTTHAMLESFKSQSYVVRAALSTLTPNLIIDEVLLQDVDELRHALHIFLEALRVLDPSLGGGRGQSGFSVAVIIPVMKGLKRAFASRISSLRANSRIRDVLERTRDGLNGVFVDLELQETYAIASLLDPRFKSRVFESTRAAHAAEERLREIAVAERAESFGSVTRSQFAGANNESSRRCSKRSRSMSDIDHASNYGDEAKQYLAEPTLPFSANVAEFWNWNSGRWPFLARTAAKFLCVPASAKHQYLPLEAATVDDACKSFGNCDAVPLLFLRLNLLLGMDITHAPTSPK